MQKLSQLAWRIAIACLAGLMMSGICLYSSSQGVRSVLQETQTYTRKKINQAAANIDAYHSVKHQYPKSLSELPNSLDGVVRDRWGNPLIYIPQSHHYLLISYGKDGKSGGNGLDCDLSNQNPFPPQSQLSLWYVLAHPASSALRLGALLCGFLTAFLTFYGIRATDLTRRGLLLLIPKLSLILIAAAFISLTITACDIPSGH